MSGVTGGHEDWRPTGTIAALQRRSAMLTAIRRYFAGQGYWEVETPLLSSDCCVDAWIEPVVAADPAESSRRLFLQSSPEFAMKRLVAAGRTPSTRSHAFRAGEVSPRHNREFTMLEWYQVGSDCAAQMDLVEELVRTIAADSSMGPPIAATLPPDP
ncbi:MAG: amino acid--tRNA ligase-related protein [Planctomycetaceae bacterium]